MGLPLRVKVEVAFADGPAVASPTWTDISQYVSLVAGIQFNRGRGQYADSPEPGRLTLTLNNDDGRFTWGKVGGANALGRGDRPPLRQPIRLTLTPGQSDGTWLLSEAVLWLDARWPGGLSPVTVWTGYIDEWSQQWDAGFRPRVRVTASDRLAKLSLLKLDDGAIRSEVLYDSPVAYYPLNEQAGSTSAGNQAGTQRWSPLTRLDIGAGAGTVDFGAGASPDGVGTGAAFTQTSVTNGRILTGLGPGGTYSAFTVEAWVYAASWDASGAEMLGLFSSVPVDSKVNPPTSVSYYPGSGVVNFQVNVDNAVDVTLSPATGTWLHFALTCNGTTIRAYYQGAEVGTAAVSGTPFLPTTYVTLGATAPPSAYATAAQHIYEGQMAHVAVYSAALSADRILQHYNAGKGTGSFYGESSADRFTRLCRLSGLPATAYATDATATTPVGAQNLGGVGMLDAIKQVTDSERGAVYLSGAGVLTYKSATTLATQAVGATLANTDIEGDLSLVLNDQNVVNDVTVTRVGGATQRRADTGSQATMGVTNATTVDTILTSDAEAAALADLLLSQGTAVQPRTGNLTVDLVTRAATVDSAALLALDTGARVRVTGLPASFPTDTIDLSVDGVAGSINAQEAKVTLTVHPVLTVKPFLLEDATYGVLDQTTRLGYV